MHFSKIGFFASLFFFSNLIYSQMPPIGIELSPSMVGDISTGSNRGSVAQGAVLFIAYSVKNNTSRRIQFSPQLSDATHPVFTTESNSNNCFLKSFLAPKEQCLLVLMINGSEMPPSGIHGGPYVDLNAYSTAMKSNPFWRYEPPTAQQLDVSYSSEVATGLSASVSGVTLSVNDTTLNAALTGKARSVTITNTTSSTIPSISYATSAPLPEGTTISTSNECTNLQPSGTCTLTITPGAQATTDPILMYISGGSDTNEIILPINILTYGTIYQSGYVFSVDDTTASTVSALGKVAALKNQETFWPFGIIWASNGQTNCSLDEANGYAPCTYYTFIDGITETSSVQAGDACNGNSDGQCDTTQIISAVNSQSTTVSESLYAAGICDSLTIEQYSDWYLPSICEMGYFVVTGLQNIDSGCGTEAQPLMQNMASNLADLGIGGLFGVTWSSTEYSGDDGTTNNAWSQYYLGRTRYQTHDGKEDPSGVRCVRALTQP